MPNPEIPLLFRKRPFGTISFAELCVQDKGSLIDEQICFDLGIPIKNLQYQKFTVFPGTISRCVGHVKITTQRIQAGKIGESVQFTGKVIRNLSQIIGADAISGHKLSSKLSSLPIAKPSKPHKLVQKWLHDYHKIPEESCSHSSNSFKTSYPTGTPSQLSCNCEWSCAAAFSSSSQTTKCCNHVGLCKHCTARLEDVEEEGCSLEEDHFGEEEQEEELYYGCEGKDSDCGDPEHPFVGHHCLNRESHENQDNQSNSADQSDSYNDYYKHNSDRLFNSAMQFLTDISGNSPPETYSCEFCGEVCGNKSTEECRDKLYSADFVLEHEWHEEGIINSDISEKSPFHRQHRPSKRAEYFQKLHEYASENPPKQFGKNTCEKIQELNQLNQELEEDELMSLAYQYGYDLRTNTVEWQ